MVKNAYLGCPTNNSSSKLAAVDSVGFAVSVNTRGRRSESLQFALHDDGRSIAVFVCRSTGYPGRMPAFELRFADLGIGVFKNLN